MISDNKLTVIIVEDESASREYLEDVLTSHFPELSIVAYEDTVHAAADAINRLQPDIVFLDVEIKQGTGFDVLAQVDHQSFKVIFTTAFSHFAIDAFQFNTIDYLLKPLKEEKLISAVHRCIQKIKSAQDTGEIHRLLQYLKSPLLPQRLAIHTMQGLEFIQVEELLFAEAQGNYCRLKLKSGQYITITKKIKELEDQLHDVSFFRIHNSYLVNIRYIRKYIKGRGGSIVMEDSTTLPVSSARKELLLRLLASS